MSHIGYNKDWLVRRKSWPVAIPASKAGTALNELVDLIGRDWVTEKVGKYRAWKKDNSLNTPQFLFHREPDCNPLIPDFSVALDYLSGSFSRKEAPEKYQAIRNLGNLAGSIFHFEKFWRAIPDGMGKKHISSTLKNKYSCRGMLAELVTAIHFVQCDADEVIPFFMDPRTYEDKTDILVKWKGVEIEVHCKSKIPGAGYAVPFDTFDYWAGCFLRDTEFFRRNWHVKLEISSNTNFSQAKVMRHRIKQWLSSKLVFEKVSMDGKIVATSEEILIPPSGLSTQDVKKLSRKPRYRAFSARQGRQDGKYHAISVFDVVTTNIPRPASSLSNSLREIKRRLTGTRPVIASIHMFDTWDLGELLSPQMIGFQYWLNNTLSDENGEKISIFTLTCEQGRQPLTSIIGTQQNPALTLLNHNAPLSVPESFLEAYKQEKT